MASALHPLYDTWIAQVLPGSIPEEKRATCNNCAMCPPADTPSALAEPSAFFNPQVKCCTYLPKLPNFLVGRILADDTPEAQQGLASVIARIHKGVAVTPLGLDQDEAFRSVYYRERSAVFGKSLAFRCPHYIEEGGLCGIWRHRESTCVTWFCKHERGKVGRRFWQALTYLLREVEHTLARWCVQQLDLSTEARLLLFSPPSQAEDTAAYRARWGRWADREQEFYRASAALVNPLTWEQVCAIGGPVLQGLIHAAQDGYHKLRSEEIPTLLQVRPLKEIKVEGNSCQIISYSPYDPLRLPKALLDALPTFDGRPTEQARQTIETEKQLALDDTLMRKLVDYELLAAPDGEATPQTPHPPLAAPDASPPTTGEPSRWQPRS